MIKILTITGSPVEESSTDLILLQLQDKIVEELDGSPVSTEFHRLNGMIFVPCQACGEAPKPKFCFYDDLDELYSMLAECDCLLFGSPIYFDSVSAQAKAFIDRCNCFRPADFENENPDHRFIKLLKRKRPGAMVLVGGEEGWFEGARRTIAGYFKWIEVTNEGSIFYRTPDYNTIGTAIEDDDTLAEIEQLSKELAEKIRANHA